MRSNYIGMYVQDNWRVSPNVTLNVGLRWDPYFPAYSGPGEITHFDRARFDAGLKSSVFPNAPAGLIFTGDDGMPGKSVARRDLWNFAPRVGVVWDPQGEGLETLRVAYGRLYDLPHLQTYTGLAQMSPWGNAITLNNLPKGWDDPWSATPGGDPIPALLNGPSANSVFPLGRQLHDVPARLAGDGRRSVERQLPAADRNRLDGVGELHRQHDESHLGDEPDQSGGLQLRARRRGNTQARRVLNLQNPAEGKYFASIQEVDDDGTSNYNGVLLSVQRRRGNGLSLQGNYTISRCITDRWNSEPGVAGVPYDDSRQPRGGPRPVPEFAGPQPERVGRVPDPGGWSGAVTAR